MNSSRKTAVQHARDRAARAGADVGGGARDGAGDADAAEQRRADIGDALRRPARSWSGGGGRSCRRPPPPTAATRWRPAARWRRAVGQGRRNFCQATVGQRGHGSVFGMPPKRDADGRDVEMQQAGSRGGADHGDQEGRASAAASGAAARMTAMASSATATVRSGVGDSVRQCLQLARRVVRLRAASRGRADRDWLTKMMTAMPAVKPTVTG